MSSVDEVCIHLRLTDSFVKVCIETIDYYWNTPIDGDNDDSYEQIFCIPRINATCELYAHFG